MNCHLVHILACKKILNIKYLSHHKHATIRIPYIQPPIIIELKEQQSKEVFYIVLCSYTFLHLPPSRQTEVFYSHLKAFLKEDAPTPLSFTPRKITKKVNLPFHLPLLRLVFLVWKSERRAFKEGEGDQLKSNGRCLVLRNAQRRKALHAARGVSRSSGGLPGLVLR